MSIKEMALGLIAAGASDEEVAAKIRAEVPGSRTTPNSVAWYRSQCRDELASRGWTEPERPPRRAAPRPAPARADAAPRAGGGAARPPRREGAAASSPRGESREAAASRDGELEAFDRRGETVRLRWRSAAEGDPPEQYLGVSADASGAAGRLSFDPAEGRWVARVRTQGAPGRWAWARMRWRFERGDEARARAKVAQAVRQLDSARFL